MPEESKSGPAVEALDGGRADGRRDYFIRYRRGLRWRLLGAYVPPLLLLSILFHYQYTTTMEVEVRSHLKSVAENQRNTVDLFLRERVSNLANCLGSLKIPTDSGHIEQVLKGLRSTSPAFTDVGLFDPSGILVSYAGPHAFLLGKNYAAEEWYQQLQTGDADFCLSDVYLGFRGTPHFITAVRRSVDGPMWALRASVDPEKFGEFVRASHLVREAESFIINRKGERQTISTREQARSAEGEFSPQVSGDTTVFTATVEDQDTLNAVAWLTMKDWAVVVRVPTAKALAPVRRARIILVSLTLLALALVVVFADRSARKVSERLASGDREREELRGHLFNAAKLASVGEMAAGVAHEINNPLAIIHEEASLLKDLMDPQFGQEADPKEFREGLDAIVEATLRGRTITRNLLAFSREHDPVLMSEDINEIVGKVLMTKETEFRVSNIEIRKELAGALPKVLVNRNQIEQVLYNLLHNARDAIGRGGRVTVRTRRAGAEVQIDIEDTGCGMTEEQMERIFFPFYTTKGVGKGTGLGLSISYGIVKSLGGGIEVRSAVGKGTTFVLALPVREKRSAS